MTAANADRPPGAPARPVGTLRALLARHGRAMLLAAAATLAVQLAPLLIGRLGGTQPLLAALAALAAATVWVALATPVLAAGADDALGALLRAAAVIDTGAVSLLVVWAVCPEVTLLAALKIYCILGAMGLAATAATRLARTPAGRYTLAVVAAVVLLISLAGPFWIGGPMLAADQDTANRLVAAAVHANGFYCVTAAVADEARFVWHRADVMYRITRIGDYAAPPAARWYASALLHAAVAAVLAALAVLLRRHKRLDRIPGT